MGPKSPLARRLWLGLLLPFLADGCGASSGPVRTVSYFEAHPKEREALVKRCADDPGTLGESAACVNATQAEAIEGIGSFRDLAPMAFSKVPGAQIKPSAAAPNPNNPAPR